jgi:WD40 repeat protein
MSHEGYVSCHNFLSETQFLSSSGDGTSRIYDIPNQNELLIFRAGDEICSQAINPTDPNMFLTGSVRTQFSTLLWDIRTGKPTHRFQTGSDVDAAT